MSQIVMITGASRGIGQMLYTHFSAKKVTTFGTTNSSPNPGFGLDHVDIRSFSEVQNWINSRIPDGAHVTLINCAGVNYNAMAHAADPSTWADVIGVNLCGTFNVIRAVLPKMRSTGFGRIINFGSVVGQRGAVGASAYAASKSALSGLTKTISLENASKGITINTINLGYFDIGMIGAVPEKHLAKILESIPIGRLGNPSCIVTTVEYLIGTADITGSSIDLNGGLL